jgi:hypothetical protein
MKKIIALTQDQTISSTQRVILKETELEERRRGQTITPEEYFELAKIKLFINKTDTPFCTEAIEVCLEAIQKDKVTAYTYDYLVYLYLTKRSYYETSAHPQKKRMIGLAQRQVNSTFQAARTKGIVVASTYYQMGNLYCSQKETGEEKKLYEDAIARFSITPNSLAPTAEEAFKMLDMYNQLVKIYLLDADPSMIDDFPVMLQNYTNANRVLRSIPDFLAHARTLFRGTEAEFRQNIFRIMLDIYASLARITPDPVNKIRFLTEVISGRGKQIQEAKKVKSIPNEKLRTDQFIAAIEAKKLALVEVKRQGFVYQEVRSAHLGDAQCIHIGKNRFKLYLPDQFFASIKLLSLFPAEILIAFESEDTFNPQNQTFLNWLKTVSSELSAKNSPQLYVFEKLNPNKDSTEQPWAYVGENIFRIEDPEELAPPPLLPPGSDLKIEYYCNSPFTYLKFYKIAQWCLPKNAACFS